MLRVGIEAIMLSVVVRSGQIGFDYAKMVSPTPHTFIGTNEWKLTKIFNDICHFFAHNG
jgi:hypothetical protein